MAWKDEVPKQPGFYWAKTRTGELIVAQYDESGGYKQWVLLGDERDFDSSEMRGMQFWDEPMKLPGEDLDLKSQLDDAKHELWEANNRD